MNHKDKYWHALYVRSRAEKKVFAQLEDMGVQAYLPLVTNIKQWSDRRKKIQEPLFKSYVFVYSNEKEHLSILNVYGVLRFVCFERKAVIVPDNQIVAIKRYVEEVEKGESDHASDNENLKKGQLVRIISGPMKGLVGRLDKINDKRRLIVFIEVVGQYIPVNIPRTKVEPVAENMPIN